MIHVAESNENIIAYPTLAECVYKAKAKDSAEKRYKKNSSVSGRAGAFHTKPEKVDSPRKGGRAYAKTPANMPQGISLRRPRPG